MSASPLNEGWTIRVIPSRSADVRAYRDVAIWVVEQAVRPLIFATDIEGFPFALPGGTGFLVGHVEDGLDLAFVITTRHSLGAERFGVPLLGIVTDDTARSVLPLTRGHFIPEEEADGQWTDLTIIEMDWPSIPTPVLRLVPLIQPRDVWTRAPYFFVAGFPGDRSSVDPDNRIVTLERVVLEADYDGHSQLKYLHKLRIRNPDAHPSFSGWSGSPVIALLPRQEGPPDMAFCGVALTGTPSSGMVHFVDAQVVLALLHRVVHPNEPLIRASGVAVKRAEGTGG